MLHLVGVYIIYILMLFCQILLWTYSIYLLNFLYFGHNTNLETNSCKTVPTVCFVAPLLNLLPVLYIYAVTNGIQGLCSAVRWIYCKQERSVSLTFKQNVHMLCQLQPFQSSSSPNTPIHGNSAWIPIPIAFNKKCRKDMIFTSQALEIFSKKERWLNAVDTIT